MDLNYGGIAAVVHCYICNSFPSVMGSLIHCDAVNRSISLSTRESLGISATFGTYIPAAIWRCLIAASLLDLHFLRTATTAWFSHLQSLPVSLNHLFSQKVPHSQLPDASDVRMMSETALLAAVIKDTPFHTSKDLHHHAKSEHAPADKHTWWLPDMSPALQASLWLKGFPYFGIYMYPPWFEGCSSILPYLVFHMSGNYLCK